MAARADEIAALAQAWQRRDDDQVKRVFQVIAANARRGGKPSRMADQLDRIIGRTRAAVEAPKDKDSGMHLARFREPSAGFDSLTLGRTAQDLTDQFLSEIEIWAELDEHGIRRRNRVLLYGPAGCGKSSLASALASKLGRELLVVETAAITGSLLGQTAKNVAQLFDFLEQGEYVVLFDEFDSIAQDRNAEHEHGEIRRSTNVLLQKIEEYTGDSILVAATNHETLLDHAIWRRFDLVLELPLPTLLEIATILSVLPVGLGAPALESKASELMGLSHAAAAFARDTAWRLALTDRRTVPTEADLDRAIALTRDRPWN